MADLRPIQLGQNFKRGILITGDVIIFQASLLLTLWIRYGSLTSPQLDQHLRPFFILMLLWLMGIYIAGLYDLTLGQQPVRLFRTYLEGMIGNLAVAVGFFYLIPVFGIAPRTNLFLHFAIFLFLGYMWRLFFHNKILSHFTRGRVLFIGPADEATTINDLLKHSSLGLDLVAILPIQGHAETHLGCLMIENAKAILPLLHTHHIQAIVLGIRLEDVPEIRTALYESLFTQVTILDRAEIEEATTGRIPLSYVNEGWFLHHLRESDKTWYENAKRFIDLLLAIPFGILTLLIFPLVAFLIHIMSRGPILYSQIRVGRGGKQITIWKFRSMHIDSEKQGPQFTPSTATDPRVTPIGRILRQLRIDELPQIWSVLKGDLSFVGPRPERPEFVSPLIERVPYYALRHLTRPGLTGWAQVRFLTPTTRLEDNLKKLQYDLFYIKHRSLMLDLAILLKTIGIVLRRQGT